MNIGELISKLMDLDPDKEVYAIEGNDTLHKVLDVQEDDERILLDLG